MPIYKMDGSKDGKQKYRVRINYTDVFGKARQTEKKGVSRKKSY